MTRHVTCGRAAEDTDYVGLRAERTGPDQDAVKITHRLGIDPDDVVTPLLIPKRVLDLDEVYLPLLTLEGL